MVCANSRGQVFVEFIYVALLIFIVLIGSMTGLATVKNEHQKYQFQQRKESARSLKNSQR